MAEQGKHITWIPVPKDEAKKVRKHAYCVGNFIPLEKIRYRLVKNWNPYHDKDIDLRTSPDYSCYNIKEKDKSILKETHAKCARFPITYLIHDTERKNVLAILKDEIMRKGCKKKNEITADKIEKFSSSWWSLALNEKETGDYRTSMTKEIKKALWKNNNNNQDIELLGSHPFSQTAKEQYGSWRFSVKINHLFDCYKSSVHADEYQMRILCTEVYTHEVMYAILVHPASMKDHFDDLLPTLEEYMEEETNPVVKKDDDQLMWHPQSTSIRHPDFESYKESFNKYTFYWPNGSEVRHQPKLKQWDNLTFAFLIPENCDGIKISSEDLIKNLQILDKENLRDKSDEMEAFLRILGEEISHKICDIIPLFAERFNDNIGELINIAQTHLKKKGEVKEQEDKMKEALFKFWDVIQDNICEVKFLSLSYQCSNIEKLIEIVRMNLQDTELRKHEEKLRVSIAKLWSIIETKSAELGKSIFEHISKLTMDSFPEEFPGHCLRFLLQSVGRTRYLFKQIIWRKLRETVPLLDNKPKNMAQKKLSPAHITEEEDKIKGALLKFWDIIQENLSQGNQFEMIDQCKNMKELIKLIRQKFGEIFPEELPKHEEKLLMEAIVKVWDIIKTNLIAYGKQGNEDQRNKKAPADDFGHFLSVIEGVFNVMKELPPEESLGYYQIVSKCFFLPDIQGCSGQSLEHYSRQSD